MSNERESDRPLAEILGFDPGEEILPGEEEGLAATAIVLREATFLQELWLPEVAPAETERLIAAISASVQAPENAFAAELSRAWARRQNWLARTLTTVQPQVRVLSRPFWIASAALVAAGLPLLTADLSGLLGADLTYGAFLLLIAPIMAVLGVAHAFRSTGTGMAEVELACALTPAQLILGRLFWVTAYDALLLGAASLLSAATEPGVRLGLLVLGWLMPMLAMALGVLALTLYVPPWAGGGAVLALWAAVLSVLLTGSDRSLAEITGSAVILPITALCGTGAVLLASGIAAAWPRLAARLAGLGNGGRSNAA